MSWRSQSSQGVIWPQEYSIGRGLSLTLQQRRRQRQRRRIRHKPKYSGHAAAVLRITRPSQTRLNHGAAAPAHTQSAQIVSMMALRESELVEEVG